MLYNFLCTQLTNVRYKLECLSLVKPSKANGKQSTVNKSLDGSMYPSQKLAHLALGKKIIIVKNATAYTWDWYCHLVVGRASLMYCFEGKARSLS
jgi:hypothetical protein